MRRFLRITLVSMCVVVLFQQFVTEQADAAIYYVSPNGNDSNSGSSATPFKTIQKAANIVNPGDTVIVKDGIYTDTDGDDRVVSMTRGGTASNWITFKSETIWGAVLDGQSNSTGYGWVFSAGSAYIQVEDFDIKGCSWQGFHSNVPGVHDIYLYGNKIHDIGRVCTDVTDGRDAFYQGDGTYNFTYDSNVVHTIGRLHTDSTCGDPNHWYNHDHGIYMFGTNNTVINNVFYDLQSGWGIQMAPGAANVYVINNTFSGANPGRDGQITLWGGQTGMLIENNIFNQPKNAAIVNSDCTGDSGIEINNNITSVSSMISGTSTCLRLSGNTTGTDPKHVDPTNNDFHLQPASPAINKGINTGLTYDADGDARSGNPDLGAYEYAATTTPSPAPQPPSGNVMLMPPATSGLVWDDTYKRLGVGTVNPGLTLDIIGAHVSGTGMARFTGSDKYGFMTTDTTANGPDDESGFLVKLGGTLTGQFGARKGDNAVYIKNRVYGMADIITIASTGNVGIGTTIPTQTLEVSGGIRINPDVFKPVCDSNARGTFWSTQGSTNDVVEVCAMVNGSMAWKALW